LRSRVYGESDRREAERKRQLRERMIGALPNPSGRPGLEFLPVSSEDKIISKWKSHLERWYKEMLGDCNCKKAFKEAGLDLEATDRLGVIVGSASSFRDESMSDAQVKVPRDIRFNENIRQSILNEDRGFTFFVPGSSDTRAHVFLSPQAFSGGVFETNACSLRRTFVHELIHAAGAGGQKPNWFQVNILRDDDLSTWMPGEYAKIIEACGCK
jgi:hypothetical protein